MVHVTGPLQWKTFSCSHADFVWYEVSKIQNLSISKILLRETYCTLKLVVCEISKLAVFSVWLVMPSTLQKTCARSVTAFALKGLFGGIFLSPLVKWLTRLSQIFMLASHLFMPTCRSFCRFVRGEIHNNQ